MVRQLDFAFIDMNQLNVAHILVGVTQALALLIRENVKHQPWSRLKKLKLNELRVWSNIYRAVQLAGAASCAPPGLHVSVVVLANIYL